MKMHQAVHQSKPQRSLRLPIPCVSCHLYYFSGNFMQEEEPVYAYRTKWHIKEGCVEEAVELLRGSIAYFKERGKVAHVYFEPQVSQRNVMVWEEDWEDPEAHDAFWADESELQTSEEIFLNLQKTGLRS